MLANGQSRGRYLYFAALMEVGRLLSADILLRFVLPFDGGCVMYCISSHSGLYVTTCSNYSVSSPSRLAWRFSRDSDAACRTTDGVGGTAGKTAAQPQVKHCCYSSRIMTYRLNGVKARELELLRALYAALCTSALCSFQVQINLH